LASKITDCLKSSLKFLYCTGIFGTLGAPDATDVYGISGFSAQLKITTTLTISKNMRW